MDNNNNNNNFNYNQPMQQPNQVNTNMQINQQPNYSQPMINQQPINNSQPMNNNIENNKKSNNKIFIILIVLLVIGGGIFYFITRNKNLENGDYNTKTSFLMQIDNAFDLNGKRVAVDGKVLRGSLKVGDMVQTIGLDKEIKTVTVSAIGMYGTNGVANTGDTSRVTLEGITIDEVEEGQVLAAPNTITAHKKFEASLYVLTAEEGGRHSPFYSNYKPSFHFRTVDIRGVITLPNDIEMVKPGDSLIINVELEKSIAMEVGTEFTMVEGGRTIGKLKIIKLK